MKLRLKHGALRMIAVGLAVASLGACATLGGGGKDDPEGDGGDARMDRTRRGIANAATTPLRDVGLIRPEIPNVLNDMTYPYLTTSLAGGCPNILYEIGQLDAVLGPEDYQPEVRRAMRERGMDAAASGAVNAAEDTAGDIVPFRGWVRRLSGATRAEREFAQAIEIGQMRRAFLRGFGASLGCRYVLPAPPPGAQARNNQGSVPNPP
ncbi:MAG: hypothetical protein JNJ73_03990 [Hyphomonadaceae bacterium]|nr:hypothetical protein [Hyphomonadaceae bacterium]